MIDLSKVMEREQLCSEHAAQCFLEAGRRMSAKKRKEKRTHELLERMVEQDSEWCDCGALHDKEAE